MLSRSLLTRVAFHKHKQQSTVRAGDAPVPATPGARKVLPQPGCPAGGRKPAALLLGSGTDCIGTCWNLTVTSVPLLHPAPSHTSCWEWRHPSQNEESQVSLHRQWLFFSQIKISQWEKKRESKRILRFLNEAEMGLESWVKELKRFLCWQWESRRQGVTHFEAIDKYRAGRPIRMALIPYGVLERRGVPCSLFTQHPMLLCACEVRLHFKNMNV